MYVDDDFNGAVLEVLYYNKYYKTGRIRRPEWYRTLLI